MASLRWMSIFCWIVLCLVVQGNDHWDSEREENDEELLRTLLNVMRTDEEDEGEACSTEEKGLCPADFTKCVKISISDDEKEAVCLCNDRSFEYDAKRKLCKKSCTAEDNVISEECKEANAECADILGKEGSEKACVCKENGFDYDDALKKCYSEACSTEEGGLCPADFTKCVKISISHDKKEAVCLCNDGSFEYDPKRKICKKSCTAEDTAISEKCSKANAECAEVLKKGTSKKSCVCKATGFSYDDGMQNCYSEACSTEEQKLCPSKFTKCVKISISDDKVEPVCICKDKSFEYDPKRKICKRDACSMEEEKLCPSEFTKCVKISISDDKIEPACICNDKSFEYDPKRKICKKPCTAEDTALSEKCSEANAECVEVLQKETSKKSCICKAIGFSYDDGMQKCYKNCGTDDTELSKKCSETNAKCAEVSQEEGSEKTCVCKAKGFKYDDGIQKCYNRECNTTIKETCLKASTKCLNFYEGEKNKTTCECKKDSLFDETKKICRRKCKEDKDCQNKGKCEKSLCSCNPGLDGDFCDEIVDCLTGKYKLCKETGGTCTYDIDQKKANCTCSGQGMALDEKSGSCKECNCGTESVSCKFDNGEKKCQCKKGFAQKNGECKECDCGGNSTSCSFDEEGLQACQCKENFYQNRGKCAATCSKNDDCKYESKCEKGQSDKMFCVCNGGLSGDFCEVIDACPGMKENCEGSGGTCKYNVKNKEAYCDCPEGKANNPITKKCEECSCGKQTKECRFDKDGSKECKCFDGAILEDGTCKKFCKIKDECDNGAECEGEEGKKTCKCKKGTEGSTCEVVTACVSGDLRNCEDSGGKCIYKSKTEKPECDCSVSNKKFDKDVNLCRETCKKTEDCKHGADCLQSANEETGVKFCKCKRGTEGDFCEVVTECKDKQPLRKKCSEGKADCIYHEKQEKAVCFCTDPDYTFYSNKCTPNWCINNACAEGKESCKFDDKKRVGYCECQDPLTYYGYGGKRCKSLDKCLLRKTPCKENQKCINGECKCEGRYKEVEGKCVPNFCEPNPCFLGAKCNETDSPGLVKCFCEKDNFFYDGTKCTDGSCFLKNHLKECKDACPRGMMRKDGLCVHENEAEKCSKDCGHGFCFNVSNKVECRCISKYSTSVNGTCILDASSVCASGRLTSDFKKCDCSGIYKYAKNGITCEKKACADKDAKDKCSGMGAHGCIDFWTSGKGYDCKCGRGYTEQEGRCVDVCDTKEEKENCLKKDQICYNTGRGTDLCSCPPTLSYNTERQKCDQIAKNTYLLHGLPVDRKPYLVNKQVDKVKLNLDIISAMQEMYQNLKQAHLFSLKQKGDVLECTVWLEFTGSAERDINRFIHQKRSDFKCKDCRSDIVLLPPSLLLSSKSLDGVSSEKLGFCSNSVTNYLCGHGAICKGNECSCTSGYRISEYSMRKGADYTIVKCEDIDECREGIHKCPSNSTCVNTVGDYYCKCLPGYKKIKETLPYKNEENKEACVDLCTPNPCGKGKCFYKDNMFDCRCQPGYGGSLCKAEDVNFAKASKNTVIVGAVLGTLLGVALILFFVYIRRLKKNSEDEFAPNMRGADNAEMMERRAARGVTNRGYQ